MGLPEFVEIDNVIDDDNTYSEVLNSHAIIEYAKISLLKKYIECERGYRVKYLYKILLCIKALDRPTKTGVCDRIGLSPHYGIKSVDYLFTKGYITKVKRARLIIPFQKYKQDTGYKLSVKGKAAIYAIIKASLPVK